MKMGPSTYSRYTWRRGIKIRPSITLFSSPLYFSHSASISRFKATDELTRSMVGTFDEEEANDSEYFSENIEGSREKWKSKGGLNA